ncbi:MAG: DUF3459 domain-containing protein, partial [Actinobacteria bacterium]|nr:DUF3459 domain-containing protein [Actinomycetota bacterium]
FDLTHPEAREYLLGVARHWVTRFGADGIRMDVTRYVEPGFWREARSLLRASKDDVYLLCEIFGEAGEWLQGDSFDGTMNYVARRLLLGFCSGEIDGGEWLRRAERMVSSLTPEALQASQVLLGSHDTPRFLTEAGGERWRLDLGTLLQFTLPGVPSVYYGDEVYLEGGGDPACRGAFPWGAEVASPLADAIKELSALRRAHPALRRGDWQPQGAGAEWVSFSRRLGHDDLLVVANRGPKPVAVGPGKSGPVWGSVSVSDGELVVAPRSGAILARVS